MKKILQKIRSGKILVSDGAWGTFLQLKGLFPGECPESWNLSNQNAIYEIAKSYIDAGSDMIQSNTFGGNYFKLKNYHLENKISEINQTSIEISRKAAGDKFVIASMGPTGKILMMGDVTEEEMYEAFKLQAIAFEKGGADAACIETMTDLQEAQIAIKAVKDNTNLEVICTMNFDKTVDNRYRTMMGISPEEMTEALSFAGADIIGTNCGNGLEGMVEIVKLIRVANKDIPVLVHANAGMPILENGKTIFPESPEQFARLIPQLIEAGANIIGGCCGTTPDHIRVIANFINK